MIKILSSRKGNVVILTQTNAKTKALVTKHYIDSCNEQFKSHGTVETLPTGSIHCQEGYNLSLYAVNTIMLTCKSSYSLLKYRIHS